jgi:hypothetical protein
MYIELIGNSDFIQVKVGTDWKIGRGKCLVRGDHALRWLIEA